MSILSFINKVCVQTAVYWGNPKPDGFGGYIFDAPIEIKCRWEDMPRVRTAKMSKEIHQKSNVLITRSVDLEGWMYLGTLIELENAANNFIVPSNPQKVKEAYQIIAIDKTPLFRSTTKFVYNVTFGFGNTQN